MDKVEEWTSLPMPELLAMASRRKDWTKISAESSLMFPATTELVERLNYGRELGKCTHRRQQHRSQDIRTFLTKISTGTNFLDYFHTLKEDTKMSTGTNFVDYFLHT